MVNSPKTDVPEGMCDDASVVPGTLRAVETIRAKFGADIATMRDVDEEALEELRFNSRFLCRYPDSAVQ